MFLLNLSPLEFLAIFGAVSGVCRHALSAEPIATSPASRDAALLDTGPGSLSFPSSAAASNSRYPCSCN